jgi:hypothetical protein
MLRQRIYFERRKRWPDHAWFDCGGIVTYTGGQRRKVGGVFEFGAFRVEVQFRPAYAIGDGLNRLIWRWIDWRNPA